MKDGFNPHAEYFEANAGRIDYIVRQIDALVANSPFVIELESMDGSAEITEGRLIPDDIDPTVAAAGGLSPEELAILENNVLAAKSEMRLGGLQTRVTLKHDLAIVAEKEAEGWDDDQILAYADENLSGLLDYQNGEVRIYPFVLDDGRTAEIHRIKIDGLEEYGQAVEYRVTLTDSTAEKSLEILTIGGEVDSVASKLKPINNPLFERAFAIMGLDAHSKITQIVVASIRGEDELDEAIGNIYQEYQGTAHEEEIGPLLDEMRNQAMSSREFAQMGLDLYQPSQEDLDEFIGLLDLAA